MEARRGQQRYRMRANERETMEIVDDFCIWPACYVYFFSINEAKACESAASAGTGLIDAN